MSFAAVSCSTTEMKEAFDQFLRTLEQTERLPARGLAHYQQNLLVRLVRHAYTTLPFYRDRLGCLFAANGDVDLSRWNDVPLLKRDDVAARGGEMRVPDLGVEYGEIAEVRTSGSTGMPLPITTNGLMFLAANALFTRTTRWFGLDTSRPLAAIRRFTNEPAAPYPEGKVGNGWSFTDPHAPKYELELMTPVEQQLEWLARHKAPYLLTQASGALAIAYAVTPEQGRALGIEMVFLVGETIPDGTRELVEERLGARLAGIYSCQEIGTVASECEVAPHYHVAAENALVEIVDDYGRDVAPGERGRVVVTGLYNYAMPFIRYQLGDVAVAGTGPCKCGRTLPVISRVEGRTRNAFVFRDGTRMWPRAAMIRPMQVFVPFRRYQLVQRDYEKIEFRYVADGSGRSPDLAGLNACARSVLHPTVEVSLVEMEALSAGPSGKFEEFISDLELPDAAVHSPEAARP
jgi:phenylacetate-CoA ligase